MKTTKTPRLHYAWIVLGTACVLSIAARADSASFAVFVDPLVKLFGWKRGEISFAYSLAFLFGLPATIAMGWLGDRYGARPLMIVASFIISIGTVLLGTMLTTATVGCAARAARVDGASLRHRTIYSSDLNTRRSSAAPRRDRTCASARATAAARPSAG